MGMCFITAFVLSLPGNDWSAVSAGFVQLRENLENLEKGTFLKKNQGKPGKLREFSDHFYNLKEN